MDAKDSDNAIVFWLRPDDPYRWRPFRRLVITETAIRLRSDGSESERTIAWEEIEHTEVGSSRYSGWLTIHFRSGALEYWQPIDAIHLAYSPSETLLGQRVLSSRLSQGVLPVIEPNPYLRSELRPMNDWESWNRYRSPQEYQKEGRIPSTLRRLVPLVIFVTVMISGLAALFIWGGVR